MWCVLLAALLSGIGVHAAVTETKKPSKQQPKQQPVSAVADTQASARRQGAVNVSGINWACSGAHCSTSTVPSAVAAPVAVCQGLARIVGVMRSFKVANRPLNGNELQQCNSVVPAVASAIRGMKTPQGAGLPPAAGPLPAGPFLPVAVRTPQLTLTGIGVAETSYRFTPVAVRTPRLTLTGTGVAETSYRFTPVAVRTPRLTLTGTGRSE
jgi:hypothetical protein